MVIWQTWKRCSKGDYWYASIPKHPNSTQKGYVLEHRAIMENKLGRLLTKEEIVHHINGNGKDNREDNLELLKVKEHNDYHSKEKKRKHRIKLVCAFCGVKFERKANKVRYAIKKGQTQFCCSCKCNGKLNH